MSIPNEPVSVVETAGQASPLTGRPEGVGEETGGCVAALDGEDVATEEGVPQATIVIPAITIIAGQVKRRLGAGTTGIAAQSEP